MKTDKDVVDCNISNKITDNEAMEMLRKNVANLSVVKSGIREDYKHMLRILEIQNNKVCKEMHKAMSPISAIAGYLELMEVLLDKDTNRESLQRYRNKIEEGVKELGEIVEDLYETFDDADSIVQEADL